MRVEVYAAGLGVENENEEENIEHKCIYCSTFRERERGGRREKACYIEHVLVRVSMGQGSLHPEGNVSTSCKQIVPPRQFYYKLLYSNTPSLYYLPQIFKKVIIEKNAHINKKKSFISTS